MRTLIEPRHDILSIQEQCETLGLCRSSYYYKVISKSEQELTLMRRVEEIHYEHLEYGYRKVHAQLRREGVLVNEKKIERLWNHLGFRSSLPSPQLSKKRKEAPVYPYLLNGMWIQRPNQVFSTDITFIPLSKGFMYLVTVVDWFSRYVLSWELSNTLGVDFCIRALEKAFESATPEYFNTDQGSQFTSEVFIRLLKERNIQISFDGKGRAIDNVYQERGWWSLKYEKLYLSCCDTVPEVMNAIREYYQHFNMHRPHQGLLYAVPVEIYQGLPPKYSRGEYQGFRVKEAKRATKY